MPDDATTSATVPVPKPPHRFHRLRIAVSVFFGLLALAFAIAWPWSYQYVVNYQATWGTNRAVRLTSKPGWASFDTFTFPTKTDNEDWARTCSIYHKSSRSFASWTRHPPQYLIRFGRSYGGPAGFAADVRYLHLVLFGATLAAIAWPRTRIRFSLRSLLIATTLVAVALGYACYLVPQLADRLAPAPARGILDYDPSEDIAGFFRGVGKKSADSTTIVDDTLQSRRRDETIMLSRSLWVLVIAALAVGPWIYFRKRSSHRTMLIATTLVAVLMGLVVWLVR